MYVDRMYIVYIYGRLVSGVKEIRHSLLFISLKVSLLTIR